MTDSEPTFARLWKVIQLLGKTTVGLTLEELVAKTGFSRRTIQRYLALFRENDVPLFEEKDEATGLKTYRITLTDPKLGFTFNELVAIYFARRFLEPMMGTFLWESMQDALDKMRKTLGTHVVHNIERLVGMFDKTAFGVSDYQGRTGLIDELVVAIENSRRVVILYRSLQDEKPSPTKVSPYGLVHHDGSLYLIGYSHKREAIRHWKIDRMSGVTVTAEPLQQAEGFALPEHLAGLFGIFEGKKSGPLQRVRIRFDTYFAGQIREKHWHKTERFEEQPDGGVVLELRLRDLAPVKRWLLGFGRHAEVLESAALRQIMREEVDQLRENYCSGNTEIVGPATTT